MYDETDHKITLLFQSVLGDYANDAEMATGQIDSIAYVELLMAFQNEFKIKFSTQEFLSLRSIKNIRDSIRNKILAKA
ncbi:MAG: acyl carrier protein [Bacteriovorax sp.]|nr:acyl carrier protein [Bacteriovorax sp.]